MPSTSTVLFTPNELQQLYRYACALMGGEQDAYDLLQSSLEKYLKQNAQCKNPISYMRTIIRNSYIDQLRHDALIHWDDYQDEQTVSTDLNWNALNQTVEQLVIEEDQIQHLMSKMTGIEREIIFLWAVEGYTTAEVAEQLEMPKNTVLSRIHRLRQKLQDYDTTTGVVTGGGQ